MQDNADQREVLAVVNEIEVGQAHITYADTGWTNEFIRSLIASQLFVIVCLIKAANGGLTNDNYKHGRF